MAYIQPKSDYKDGEILYGSDLNASNEVIKAGVDDNFDRIQNLESSKQNNLIAGVGIKIEDDVISNTQTSAEWGNIQGNIDSQLDLKTRFDGINSNVEALNQNISDVNTTLNTKIDNNKILVDSEIARVDGDIKAARDDAETLFNQVDIKVEGKQDKLVSGTNIKTINDKSLLGSGNIDTNWGDIKGDINKQLDLKNKLDAKAEISDIPTKVSELDNDEGYLTQHQDISGKVDKIPGKGLSTEDFTTAEKTKLNNIDIDGKQDKLVSGTNIKTINGLSVLGSGNLEIQGSGGGGTGTVAWGQIAGNITDQQDLQDALAEKITSADIPTNISSFTNDSGYLTSVPSEYIKNTDIASESNAGVIKVKKELGTSINADGVVQGVTRSARQYESDDNNSIISKATLENVIKDKKLVNYDTLVEEVNYKVDKEGYVATDNNFTNDYKSQIESNTSLRHWHDNKAILDSITSDDIGNWNSKEVAIGDTIPTGDEVIWIEDEDEVGLGSEVVNSLSGNQTNKAPSIKIVNDKFNEMQDNIRKGFYEVLEVGTNINDLKKSYANKLYTVFNANGTLPNGYSNSDNHIFLQTIFWSEDFGRQILYDIRTNRIFSRNMSSNVWQKWQEITTTYSEEETIVGTWIDGKPLYRKIVPVTISGAIPGNIINIQVNHNIQNIKYGWVEMATRDISIEGFSYGSSGYINANNNRTQWFLDHEKLSASTDRNIDNGIWYVSICYTKTTD